MDTRELSERLHVILRTACRVRQPRAGASIDAGLVGLDEVKAGLRDLIRDVGDAAAPAPSTPPRVQAGPEAFPEGHVAGTRATVEHRRRVRQLPRGVGPAVPTAGSTLPRADGRVILAARAQAEAHFTAGANSRTALAVSAPPDLIRSRDALASAVAQPLRDPGAERPRTPVPNGRQDTLSPIQPFRRMIPATGSPAHPSADNRHAEIRP